MTRPHKQTVAAYHRTFANRNIQNCADAFGLELFQIKQLLTEAFEHERLLEEEERRKQQAHHEIKARQVHEQTRGWTKGNIKDYEEELAMHHAQEQTNNKIERLRADIDATAEAYATLEADHDLALQTVSAQDKEIETLKAQVEKLQALKQAGDDLAAVTRAKDAEIDILKRQIDGYSSDIEKTERQLNIAQEALDRAVDELNEQTKLTRDRDDLIEALRAELAEAQACTGFGEEHYTEWMSAGELGRKIGLHTTSLSKKAQGHTGNEQGVQRRGDEAPFQYRALKAAVHYPNHRKKKKDQPKKDVNPLVQPLKVLMPSIEKHRDKVCDRDTKKWGALMDLQKELQSV